MYGLICVGHTCPKRRSIYFNGSAEVETPMVYRKLNDSAALSALDISLPISLSNPGKKSLISGV